MRLPWLVFRQASGDVLFPSLGAKWDRFGALRDDLFLVQDARSPTALPAKLG